MTAFASTSALIIKAGVSYFALVFGAGFILGMIRVPLLVPRLGERVAELIEMPFMLLAIVWSARIIVGRFCESEYSFVRLGVGLFALSLLLIAEASLVVLIQNLSIADYITSRDPISGSVYLLMLVLFFLMPFIIGRMHAKG